MTINYIKCLLIGILFEPIALLILIGGESLTQGSFTGPELLLQTIVLIPYLILQGFLVVLLTVLLRDKLPTSQLKSGIMAGLLMWFFNQKFLALTLVIANIIPFISNLGMASLDALMMMAGLLTSLAAYLILGWILMYLVDTLYFKKQKTPSI